MTPSSNPNLKWNDVNCTWFCPPEMKLNCTKLGRPYNASSCSCPGKVAVGAKKDSVVAAAVIGSILVLAVLAGAVVVFVSASSAVGAGTPLLSPLAGGAGANNPLYADVGGMDNPIYHADM